MINKLIYAERERLEHVWLEYSNSNWVIVLRIGTYFLAYSMQLKFIQNLKHYKK